MRKPASIAELTALGRVRLSRNYFMRDMLYSEVGNFCCVPNYPDDPDTAIEAGRQLCQCILEPMKAAFGHVAIRSAFRSCRLNAFAHELFKAGDVSAWAADNAYNAARHAWDQRDPAGHMGATATVVIPAYVDYYQQTSDWRSLAWWIRDHVPAHDEVIFFEQLAAFNIRWYEGAGERKISFMRPAPFSEEVLTAADLEGFQGDHSHLYGAAIELLGTGR
ncbi:MAG: hypothetical protein ISP90_08195 [Nevskia sp.]|nr:hypothetical protein [Nevskia sp.]